MPILTPDQSLPELHLVVRTLVVEEPWGEMWRAEHGKHGSVLLLVYSGPSGETAFFDALTHLRQWKALALRTSFLLPILEIHDREAIPLVVVEDPGGPHLLDYHRVHQAAFLARSQLSWARDVADILDALHRKGILPVGISPHFLFHQAGDEISPWRLVPCSPGNPHVYEFLGGGEMLPGGYTPGGEGWNAGLDTWALAWIWMRLRGEKPGQPLSEEFAGPIDREARQILARCIVRGKNGTFPHPGAVLSAIESAMM